MLLESLSSRWAGSTEPLLIHGDEKLFFQQIVESAAVDLAEVQPGDVVALIGDFNVTSIRTLIDLVERQAIIAPLTKSTSTQHDYFFEACNAKWIIREGRLEQLPPSQRGATLEMFASRKQAGLILFTSGTTGLPKAILHNFSSFLERFATPRPAFRTLSFLLFDHIGGINTLFHTLFNGGVIVSPERRDVAGVMDSCRQHDVELLPTTPTFLRMLLLSGLAPEGVPKSLKLITFGTERMDEPTLRQLCELLPKVEFRQTYGMSELGILRIKARSRGSLWMQVGGEGVETKIDDGVFLIKARNKMVGYLNAADPFDSEGWYNTKDIVETDGEWVRIVGRSEEIINVGGLKFAGSEIEDVALEFPGVGFARALGVPNSVTGQHVELVVQPDEGQNLDTEALKKHLRSTLEQHKRPIRVRLERIEVSSRFKKI